MSVTVEIWPLPTHLRVTVSGDFTYEDVKGSLVRIRSAADDHPSGKLLIDCRGLIGNPSLRERFELVAFTLQLRINAILHGKSVRYVTAVVASAPLVHPGRYGIRLLVERNLKIMVCERLEDALAWLDIAPEPADLASPDRARRTSA